MGFVGVREGEGSACWGYVRLIVDLVLIVKPVIDYKVLSHMMPPELIGCIALALWAEMSETFRNSSKYQIPKGYSLLKRSYQYVKVLVSVGILGHQKPSIGRVLQFVTSLFNSGLDRVEFQGVI